MQLLLSQARPATQDPYSQPNMMLLSRDQSLLHTLLHSHSSHEEQSETQYITVSEHKLQSSFHEDGERPEVDLNV